MKRVTRGSLTSLVSDLCLPLQPQAHQPLSLMWMYQEAPLPLILLLQVWMVATITISRIICFITITIRVVCHLHQSLAWCVGNMYGFHLFSHIVGFAQAGLVHFSLAPHLLCVTELVLCMHLFLLVCVCVWCVCVRVRSVLGHYKCDKCETLCDRITHWTVPVIPLSMTTIFQDHSNVEHF